MTPTDYPVLEVYPELVKALAANPIVILQAPPGAGKSTVVPLGLMKEQWLGGQKIIMLEPRRLAASLVARRMSFLLDEEVGDRVGYRIRFESKTSSGTRVEVVTEGILTRMIQSDSSLQGVGLIVFDEFHERSLQADLALALTRQLQQVLRPDLRILIMSATIDGEKLSSALAGAPVIASSGRQYPVERKYLNVDQDLPLAKRVARAIMKVTRENEGDVLVFLPGSGDIRRVEQLLMEAQAPFQAHSLFGDMPFAKQQETLIPDRQGRRKVILSTSIAETSVTIEGIRLVIDSGYSRISTFDPRSGLSRLETVKVTRDAADQRAGRAGRLGPGICFRLWPEATHQHLVAQRAPEILGADLTSLVLELAQWGSVEVTQLDWITPPPAGAVAQAINLLQELGALAGTKLTQIGREMLSLPTHPRIAHMLLKADGNGQRALACDLAALLEERDPLGSESGADITLRLESICRRRAGMSAEGDRVVLDRIEKLSSSWRKRLNVKENDNNYSGSAGALVANAYVERIARQEATHSERYKLANGRVALLPKNDSLVTEPWLAVAQLDAGTAEGRIFLAAPVDPKDLKELITVHQTVKWDDEREMIIATDEKRIGSLVVSSARVSEVDEAQRIEVISRKIRDNGMSFLGWDEKERMWQSRVMSLRAWRGNEWPDVSDETLLGTLGTWLAPFLTAITRKSDFARLDWNTVLSGMLPWELRSKLDKLAPERIEVPTGSMIKVVYSMHATEPVMEVRLQELFGLLETPTINEGRTKIVMHLLSPGYKPVQVTRDLRSFWSTAYHEVRKELRMRYPRHFWPDDPFTAKAVRGVKRK